VEYPLFRGVETVIENGVRCVDIGANENDWMTRHVRVGLDSSTTTTSTMAFGACASFCFAKTEMHHFYDLEKEVKAWKCYCDVLYLYTYGYLLQMLERYANMREGCR
jgi:hypothetical protein